jgi:hypothetical protein
VVAVLIVVMVTWWSLVAVFRQTRNIQHKNILVKNQLYY